jgi:hypothetical protein
MANSNIVNRDTKEPVLSDSTDVEYGETSIENGIIKFFSTRRVKGADGQALWISPKEEDLAKQLVSTVLQALAQSDDPEVSIDAIGARNVYPLLGVVDRLKNKIKSFDIEKVFRLRQEVILDIKQDDDTIKQVPTYIHGLRIILTIPGDNWTDFKEILLKLLQNISLE